jgi:hypothetical protein
MMSIHTIKGTSDGKRRSLTVLPLVSGGAALILAVAAGIGLWTNTSGDVARVAGVEPTAPATTVAATRRAVVANTIAATRSTATAPADETIYLVSTPEQAGALQAGIDEAARLAAAVNVAPANARVVRWGTEPAETVLRHSNDMDPAGVRLVDLRFRPAPLNPTLSDQEMYPRWQQAQAAAGAEPVSHPTWWE